VKRYLETRTRVTAVIVAAIAVVVIVGTAAAGPAGTVKTFTGCLVAGDGVIVKVKEGDSPKSACSTGQTLARLSGGDITKISVTGALTLPNGPGTGESGDVTIGLKPEFTLPDNCATGRVAKWNGSAWVCGVDNDTTYSASTGLDLSAGNAFSIDPSHRVKNTPDCSSGQFATGFDSDGDIQCAAPAASTSGIEVWEKVNPALDALGVLVLPEDEGVDLIQMQLPAGTFLMTAVADVAGRGTDSLFATCKLRDNAFNPLPVASGLLNITDGAIGNVAGQVTLHGFLTLASPDTVRFTCFSGDGDGEVAYSTMTAVKVGTVH
jgi:hypothetical protein